MPPPPRARIYCADNSDAMMSTAGSSCDGAMSRAPRRYLPSRAGPAECRRLLTVCGVMLMCCRMFLLLQPNICKFLGAITIPGCGVARSLLLVVPTDCSTRHL